MTSALTGVERSASRPGRYIREIRTPGTHWIGCWLDPRAGLEEVEKIHGRTGTRSPDLSIVQPIASRYNDYAMITHIRSQLMSNTYNINRIFEIGNARNGCLNVTSTVNHIVNSFKRIFQQLHIVMYMTILRLPDEIQSPWEISRFEDRKHFGDWHCLHHQGLISTPGESGSVRLRKVTY
jgi:hypothetical protein